MVRTELDAPPADAMSVVVRAVCFGGWGGTVVGGIVGTIDWPIVMTSFGALFGLVAGIFTGVPGGLVLAGLARRRWPVWSTRMASALVVFAAALLVTRRGDDFTALAQPPGRTAVVLGCVIAAALVGPLIAYGVQPMVRIRRHSVAVRISRLAGRSVRWGAAAGAVAGAVAGGIVGIDADLATAAFGAVEGAILGAVSGIVLAGLAAALAIGPRLRTRR